MNPNNKKQSAQAVARRVWSEKLTIARHRVGLLSRLPPEIDDTEKLSAYSVEFERLRRGLRDLLKEI